MTLKQPGLKEEGRGRGVGWGVDNFESDHSIYSNHWRRPCLLLAVVVGFTAFNFYVKLCHYMNKKWSLVVVGFLLLFNLLGGLPPSSPNKSHTEAYNYL